MKITEAQALRALATEYIPKRYQQIVRSLAKTPKRREHLELNFQLSSITAERTLTHLHKLGIAHITEWKYDREAKCWAAYWTLGSQPHARKPNANARRAAPPATTAFSRRAFKPSYAPGSMLDIMRGSLI